MAKYLLFDTETTGQNPEDRIIQIGLMLVHSREDIEVHDELCSSEVPIKLEAMEVHNITQEILLDKPAFIDTTAFKKIEEYNKIDNYLIAHNIKFDLEMLTKEGFNSNYTLIDTLKCAQHLFEDLPYHRLQYLRYALGLYKKEDTEAKSLNVTIKSHDAIGDVLIMKLLLTELVQKVLEHYPKINPMEQLAILSNKPVLIKKFKFGKYKGELIEKIVLEDINYIEWMRNNMENLNDDMIFTLDTYLNKHLETL